MQFLLDLLWYFVIFSFFGWVASSFRSLLLEKKFSNNGFLTSPFCPMYGFSAVICYTALKPFENSKLILFIGSTLILSALMVVVGVLVEKTLKKLGAIVTEIDISTEAYSTIQSVFEDADVIYFTGGNSFFLIDQLRKTGTDELLKKELAKGKLMIGESAGAIICAPSIQYIEQMDEKPEDYSQEDDAGLDLIDFYVLPHYLTAPFKKVTEKIMTEFSDLNLCPINNRQGIVIDGEGSKVICKD